MSAGHGTRALLGAGMGLSLLLLEAGAPRGLAAVMVALMGLLPVALALGFGGWTGAGTAVAVAIAGGMLLDVSTGVVVALRQALPGLALGLALRRRWPLVVDLLLVAAVSLAGLAALLFAFAPTGGSPLALLERQVEAHVADLERLPARLGVGGDPGWAAESARAVATTMRVAGPAIVVVGLLVGAAVNYALVRVCLRGQPFRRFAEESVPDHFVWAIIGAGLLAVSGQTTVSSVGLNVLIVLTPLYAVQGLAVLRHFLERHQVPRLLQVASFALFALQPLLVLLAAGVGLSDLWLDYRQIRRAPTPA